MPRLAIVSLPLPTSHHARAGCYSRTVDPPPSPTTAPRASPSMVPAPRRATAAMDPVPAPRRHPPWILCSHPLPQPHVAPPTCTAPMLPASSSPTCTALHGSPRRRHCPPSIARLPSQTQTTCRGGMDQSASRSASTRSSPSLRSSQSPAI
jgi:hypothetical protein